MLQKEFFQVQPFNPNPYWDPVIVNLSGAQKFEQNTVFVPGKYRVELAPGIINNLFPTLPNLVSHIDHVEIITEPFIVRAYCGSNGSDGGVNPYSGPFKVNEVASYTTAHGIDVNHIFGAGGGNSYWGQGVGEKRFFRGGANCLGNSTQGAGSCCHLLPVGGVFGSNYIRAYHAAPLADGGGGSAYGGAGTSYGPSTGQADSWFTRGGNSPYGTGATTEESAGSGIGAGGKKRTIIINNISRSVVVGAGAYYNGTQWIDEAGDFTKSGSSYIRITYLGPLLS